MSRLLRDSESLPVQMSDLSSHHREQDLAVLQISREKGIFRPHYEVGELAPNERSLHPLVERGIRGTDRICMKSVGRLDPLARARMTDCSRQSILR